MFKTEERSKARCTSTQWVDGCFGNNDENGISDEDGSPCPRCNPAAYSREAARHV